MAAPALRVLAMGAAAAGVAAASLRALARPLAVEDRRLLDWEEVRRIAHSRSGPRRADASYSERGREYDAMAAELAPLMAEVTGTPVAGFPPFTVLDRHGFIDRNLVITQRLFTPIERLRGQIPDSRATALGRGVLSRYVGELFGFLSRRVLGQYDPVLMLAPVAGDASAPGEPEPAALFLVEPNVRGFEERHDVPPANLRRWLVLHELTHAWQFEAHPWLRDHIGELMSAMLMSELAGDPAAPRLPSTPAMLRSLPTVVRRQLGAVGSIQAVMSVCEGYSNFVMHQVGSRHLADFDRLEQAFHERAQQRSLVERLVLAVTGMNMKLRQYEVGERFAEAVTAEGGLALLNRVWDGPEQMPSLAELREPQRWVDRIRNSPILAG
ncbi:MAG TPA: zinc-dependent metalloprotease [Candidatus Dormibacteraeota bacterium]